MVLANNRSPRLGSIKQPLDQFTPRNQIAKQCQQTSSSKQHLRIEGRVASPIRMARNYPQEWTDTPSGIFFNPASRACRLCEGGAQALRRICPDGVERVCRARTHEHRGCRFLRAERKILRSVNALGVLSPAASRARFIEN
jgi:hypothetical protein